MQLVIDLSRLRGNIKRIRAITSNGFCAVVKAQAYGHGAAVAPYIEPIVDSFGVATVSEGNELAVLGVKKPILVLGGEVKECIYGSIAPNVVPTVSNPRDVELLVQSGIGTFSVAVNTGMNRLGAYEARLNGIIAACKRYGVKPWSVYSHVYGGISSAGEQAERFDAMTRDETLMGNRHLYCSCALDLAGKTDLYDMVRVGLAMYGYSSHTEIALTARAKIVSIFRVARGSHVGYGDYITDDDITVATVRCGYADGFRRCDKPLYMTVRGVKCRVLGQPCMDLTMIDVSSVACRVGEYAYVIKDKEDAEYLAKVYGTIVYEVLTGFNGRAERFYV